MVCYALFTDSETMLQFLVDEEGEGGGEGEGEGEGVGGKGLWYGVWRLIRVSKVPFTNEKKTARVSESLCE